MNGARKSLRRFAAVLVAATAALLALAPSAFAADGEGLWGRTTDFDVTMWGFAVIALFIILPIVLSIIQYKLDTRKERAREQLERVRKP
jgi:hypothetical protein